MPFLVTHYSYRPPNLTIDEFLRLMLVSYFPLILVPIGVELWMLRFSSSAFALVGMSLLNIPSSSPKESSLLFCLRSALQY
jgi:hypothetical protein